MEKRAISVIIAEDHPRMRNQIRTLLEGGTHIEVIGEAENGSQALRLTRKLSPDLLILDLDMPETNGLEVIRRLESDNTQTRCLVLSAYDDTQFSLEVLANEFTSYMVKDEARQYLLTAIDEIVYNRSRWISPRVTKTMNQTPVSTNQPTDTTLTPGDVWLISCLSDSASYVEFTKKIDRSMDETGALLESFCRKMGVENFEEAQEVARRLSVNWQK
jgi:DNA-binding NarL/FixJ family response regulator